MKVLKKGRQQSGWSKEYTCTGNGRNGGGFRAKLLVEQSDVFKTHVHVHVDHDIYYNFKCPECGVITEIPDPGFTPIPDQAVWEKRQRQEKPDAFNAPID